MHKPIIFCSNIYTILAVVLQEGMAIGRGTAGDTFIICYYIMAHLQMDTHTHTHTGGSYKFPMDRHAAQPSKTEKLLHKKHTRAQRI